jgi:hypothetical protein
MTVSIGHCPKMSRNRRRCLFLERVINFSTLSAMIYGRPLPLRDLVNFLDGTKSLSK